VKEATKPETRRELTEFADDPRLAEAVGKLSATAVTSMLDQLATPHAQQRIGQLTQTMTRSVILGTAQGLEHDLGPALRTTIERDVAQGMSAALNGPLRTSIGETARSIMSEGVTAAMSSARTGLAGDSSALAGNMRSTLDEARQILLTLAVLVGLCVLALMCGAIVAIARTRRTRAETERLESTLQLVLSAIRETQGQPASSEVLDILRSNLHTNGARTGRSKVFHAQA